MLFVHPKVDVRLRSQRRRRPGRWDAGRTVAVGLVLALSVLASIGALYWLVSLAPFAAVGAILILRRPTDPIGWLLLGLDRRFDRARYDAERTAAAFSSRLRDVMDMATVTTELRRTVASTMAPAALGVWLRPRDGSR